MPDSAHPPRSSPGVCPRCGAHLSGRGICAACVFDECLRKDQAVHENTPLFAQIGSYQIQEKLARGGMGVVFKARQQALNRIVAIKMLIGGRFADTEAIERFRAEAAAIARLRHPAIVAIHETGQHEGHHWFSMDFIDGPSLAELIKDGPLDPRTAVEYLRTVAEAVEHAHQQGVLHRDLKPSNILLDSDGRPHVTDFGLTREAGGDSEFTATGQIIGTPGYLPPEQAAGKRSALAPSCDVYGLGATLFHLLTGRPPFSGETLAATFKQVLNDEPARPSKLNPRVNAELETICLKCLEKEPARRYATALELAEDLGRWLRHEPILARPGNAFERLAKWARRHRALAVAYASCAVLVIALLGLLVIDNTRVHRSQREAKLRLAEALLEQARAIRLTGQAGQSREAVRLLQEAGRQELSAELAARLNRTMIAALAQPDIRTVAPTEIPLVSDFMHIAFDSAFARCVLPGGGGRFALFSLTTSNAPIPIPRLLNEADQVLCFSPDGRHVAFRRKNQTEVWDTQSKRFCIPTARSLGAILFRPDASGLVRGETNATLGFYALPSGQRTGELRLPGLGIASALAWVADDTNLIVGSESGVLEIWRPGETAPLWRRELEGAVLAVAGNSTLSQIACLIRSDRLLLLDQKTGLTLNNRALPVDESSSLAYSPDNQVLAVGHQQDGVWLLDGSTGALLLRDPARTWRIGFSADGRRIGPVWERNRAGWIEYNPSKVLRRLQPDGSPISSSEMAFDPTGRWLAAPGAAAMHIWETTSGQRALTLPIPSFYCADWRSRSGTLAVATKDGLRIWPPSSGGKQPLQVDAVRTVLPHHELHCVRFSPCGRWLATADSDLSTVHVFNATNWEHVAQLEGIRRVQWCDFSANGETLVAGSEDPPARKTWNWDGHQWQSPKPEAQHPESASFALFSPDGRYVLDCGEGIRLTDAAPGSPPIELPLASNNVQFAAAFRHDGRVLAATQNDTEIHLVDLASRKTLHVLEGVGNSRVRNLAFDPTGRWLAAMRERGEVQLWDLGELETALKNTLPPGK